MVTIAEALSLGTGHHEAGRLREAEQYYRQVLEIQPDALEALNNLGVLLRQQDHPAEAQQCFERAARLNPGSAAIHFNLGEALCDQGEFAAASAAFRRAVACNPADPKLQFMLADTFRRNGQLTEALALFQQLARALPDSDRVHANLGLVWNDLGNVEESMAASRRAIELNPGLHAAHCNLANSLQSLGRVDEAVESYRAAVRLEPDNAAQHSNLLYSLNFLPNMSASQIFAEHRQWAQRFADPLTAAAPPCINSTVPDRRLRVGYVSPHFRLHAVTCFSEPILAAHDSQSFEVFCYSDVLPAQADATTERLRGYAAQWREIFGLTDQHVSDLVRDDQIDILVDLAGHLGGNRLLMFARKPAPVQVTYIGYQNTTGMVAMDYRVTDAWADPPGTTDNHHTEELIRLPQAFFCYQPPEEAPAPKALPALMNGCTTFGSFNNFAKVTQPTLDAWARILQAVPNSRLIVLAAPIDSQRRRLLEHFERHGVNGDRVALVPGRPREQFYELIQEADIALDPFPFNGHTTTCDLLWMGVPVIAMAGETYASRFGSSALVQLGLEELIAESPEHYVAIATRLAGDVDRLQLLRGGLRQSMAESSLVDAPRFARDLEAAYRQMWIRWCEQAGASTNV